MTNNKLPLLKCCSIHQIEGRIRIFCRAFYYLKSHEKSILEKINELGFVKSVKISFPTSNVLLYYQAGTHPNLVIESIEEVVALFSIFAFQAERKEKSRLTVKERHLQEEPIGYLVRNVAAGALSLGFAFFTRQQAAPVSLIGKLSNFTALSSFSLSAPIFKNGFLSLVKTKRPNADTLTATAIIASLVSGQGVSALTIILLSDIAELLTTYSMRQTRKSIRKMITTGEKFVWKVTDESTLLKIPVEKLRKGDHVVIHAGEVISVDGSITEGSCLIDEAMITGEFMPKEKHAGHKVFAGSTIKNGTITVHAEKTHNETGAAKIINMVENASQYKARVQTFADKFSAHLIPLNFVLGAIVYAVTRNPARALSMFVVDYSCGIRLSTATALAAAISTAARNGILIKGSHFLENLAEAETVIFDKTGTLTEGKPEVKTVVSLAEGTTEQYIIELAAAAEETSTHPVGYAIREHLQRKGYNALAHDSIEVVIARGVSTSIDHATIRVGNMKFMRESGVVFNENDKEITQLLLRGESIVYVAKDNALIGLVSIMDPLRENIKKTINRLRQQRIDDIILLTGDVEQQAQLVASRMMFDRYKSEQTPEEKAKFALQLQSKGNKVIMIGDGINDAPALAYADVGIALGSKRTDIAMEAADITIQCDDPLAIPAVINLSKQTMSVVKQNFGISVGVNSIALVMGAMGALPIFWGAFIHNMTTVAVVSNSLRLFLFDFNKNKGS